MTQPCGDAVCITCSDQLLRLVVESLDPATGMARGRHQGGSEEFSVELLDQVAVGDCVLVHGGVALQRGDAATPWA
jgi:hydrogenase maturation factor